nr:serine/threonine-protein kinase atg1-like [Procambarus clarkii]
MKQLNEDLVKRLLKYKTKCLGSGAHGEVALVKWKGKPAALKVANSPSSSETIASEAEVLSLLRGTGGAPLLLGVANEPPALLLTYKGGQTLGDLYENPLYINSLIDVGLQIGAKLLEIHEAGFVHNDIKSNNIMVEGPPQNPEVSIIDFGFACANNVNVFIEADPECPAAYAPEVLRQECSTYASDVYSYGVLMQEILQASPAQQPSLEQVFREATHPNPKRRPSLRILLHRLHEKLGKTCLTLNRKTLHWNPPEAVNFAHTKIKNPGPKRGCPGVEKCQRPNQRNQRPNCGNYFEHSEHSSQLYERPNRGNYFERSEHPNQRNQRSNQGNNFEQSEHSSQLYQRPNRGNYFERGEHPNQQNRGNYFEQSEHPNQRNQGSNRGINFEQSEHPNQRNQRSNQGNNFEQSEHSSQLYHRPNRGNYSERSEHPNQRNRGNYFEQSEHPIERNQGSNRGNNFEQSEHSNQLYQRPNRGNYFERSEHPNQRNQRSNRGNYFERSEHANQQFPRPNRGNYFERSERPNDRHQRLNRGNYFEQSEHPNQQYQRPNRGNFYIVSSNYRDQL